MCSSIRAITDGIPRSLGDRLNSQMLVIRLSYPWPRTCTSISRRSQIRNPGGSTGPRASQTHGRCSV
ncbi:hypothetical protein DPMN_007957 [Dreissena polymorpha]|uniref:Uncharacterized protein n=1 Tax=Dreissena polymorpha TaxID=45954 RepID=A0A9D4MU85_DREPO|nr:hypothetical protein DPMN_007957 [Dreissena polymorpha]